MRWALLLLLSVAACAQAVQVNGNRPQLIQSNAFSFLSMCSPCTGVFLDNVASGDIIKVGLNWSTVNQTIGITDSLGNTYTMGSVKTSADGSGTTYTQTACAVITPAGGTDTLTFTGITGHFTDIMVAEFKGVGTCTADVTATAFASTGSYQQTVTVSPTTTNSNEFCTTWTGNWSHTTNFWSNRNLAVGDGAGFGNLLDFTTSGAAGSQSFSVTNNQFSGSGNAWIVTADCYKTPLAIATVALPDGSTSGAYSATLVTTGGTGSSRTWSVSVGSLPGGLSLNSSTGAITGTPSGTGTTSFTVQMTDGTNTVTQPLSIVVGSSFTTPTIVQHSPITHGPVTYSATAGNLLIVAVWGQEARGSLVYFPKYNGTNNGWVSTPKLTFTRIYPLPGVPGNNAGANGSAFSIYAACEPNSGTQTIDFLAQDPLADPADHSNISWIELSNGQYAIDDGSPPGNTAGTNTTSLSVSTSGSTVVANELVLAFGTEGITLANPVINAPFTQLDTGSARGVDFVSGYDLIASAGSYTATMQNGSTNSSNQDAMSIEAIPIRAESVNPTCPLVTVIPNVEKYRRQIW